MTDTQFAILVSVLGGGLSGLIAVIRFSFSRIVKALDDNSLAMRENTASNAVLSTKVDAIANYVQAVERERTAPAKLQRPDTKPGKTKGE